MHVKLFNMGKIVFEVVMSK